ncbi:MAG: hypothetical protein V2I32_12045 [Desulforhopalus sp.]|jgi:hypothetical protein|nr:hypothetical protein [Desulforhopalus sp.]
MIGNLIEFLEKRQQGMKSAGIIILAVIVVWSITGVDTHHAHTWLEAHLPAFWSIFALFSAVVLIFVARWLGKSGIQTREDYYDR